jgi:hypothetical protein
MDGALCGGVQPFLHSLTIPPVTTAASRKQRMRISRKVRFIRNAGDSNTKNRKDSSRMRRKGGHAGKTRADGSAHNGSVAEGFGMRREAKRHAAFDGMLCLRSSMSIPARATQG